MSVLVGRPEALTRGSSDRREQRITWLKRVTIGEADLVVTNPHHPANYAEAGVHFDAQRITDNKVCRGSYSKTTRGDILHENNLSSSHAVKYAWPIQANSLVAPALASSASRNFTRCQGQERSCVM